VSLSPERTPEKRRRGPREDTIDTLQRLAAIEDIKQLKARYFRGVDTKDAELLRGVFTADATCDYRGAATDPQEGINAVPLTSEEIQRGRDVIVPKLMEAVAQLVTVHHGCMPEIEITSETTARGVWPMVDRLRMPSSAPVAAMVGWGHYHETYRREADGWKIETLRLTRLRVDVTTREEALAQA